MQDTRDSLIEQSITIILNGLLLEILMTSTVL